MSNKEPKHKLIGTVSKELGVDQSTLRYWETKFPIAKPEFQDKKRIYDEKIITILKGIHFLITKKGYTIRKVQRLIEAEGREYIAEITEFPLMQKTIPDETTAKVQFKSLLPEETHPSHENDSTSETSTSTKIVDLTSLRTILYSASFGISLDIPEDGKVKVNKSVKNELKNLYRKLDHINSRMA